jgi:RNA polymerase sigma factor (sigma-70 family)
MSKDSVGISEGESGRSTLDWAESVCAHHRGEFVWTAKRALFSYARAHAEDIVSDVIMNIGDGAFPTLPDTAPKVVAFIKRVIQNRARHVNRREARFAPLSEDQPSTDCLDALQLGARFLLARDVAKGLEGLTTREREIARLHWLDECPSPEIATALGISLRTVKELLRRARRKLRARLAQYKGAKT